MQQPCLWPCLWRCSLPASSGAPQPSLPAPLGVHVRHAPQPQDNALRSASPVKQEGLPTILHGTTTRQARHRKTGIKAKQRAILAEAHAKKALPPEDPSSRYEARQTTSPLLWAMRSRMLKQQAHFFADTCTTRPMRSGTHSFTTVSCEKGEWQARAIHLQTGQSSGHHPPRTGEGGVAKLIGYIGSPPPPGPAA